MSANASPTRTVRTALATVAGAAGLIGAVALPAAASPAAAAVPCVQKISVVNNGGFVINYQVSTRDGQLSAPTDDYPINQFRVVDLNSTPITEGADVRPVVHAQAGNTVTGNVFVSFCNNGQTATYTASGTTLNYSVTLLT